MAQDTKKKDEYSYLLHHLPNMVGKKKPRASLVEDYYKDNVSDPQKKEALIKQLEELLEGTNLH